METESHLSDPLDWGARSLQWGYSNPWLPVNRGMRKKITF